MKRRKQHRSWLGLALGFLFFGGCVFLSACQSGLEVKVERYEGDLILEERMQFARIQAVGREATETLIRHFEVAAYSVTLEREGDDLSPPPNPQGPHANDLGARWKMLKERTEEYVRKLVEDSGRNKDRAGVDDTLARATSALSEIGSSVDLNTVYWDAYETASNAPGATEEHPRVTGVVMMRSAVASFDNDGGSVEQRRGRLEDARRRFLEVRQRYLLERGISERHNFGTLAEEIWRVLHWAITYRLWADTGNTYRQMTQDSFLRFAAQFGAEARAAIRRTTLPRSVILTGLDKVWLDHPNATGSGGPSKDARLTAIRGYERARAQIERDLFAGKTSPGDEGENLAALDNAIYVVGSTTAASKIELQGLGIESADLQELTPSSGRLENESSLALIRMWLQAKSDKQQNERSPHYMSIDETVGSIRLLVEHSALFKPETSNSLNNEMLMTGMGHFAEQLNSLRAAVEHTDPALAEYAHKFKRYVDGLAEKEQRRSVWSTASSVNRYGRPVFNPNGSQYHTLLYEVWRVSAGNYQRISSLANFIMRSDRLKHHVPSELSAEIGKHNHKYRRGGTSHQREFRNEQWHRILEAEQLVANAIRDGIITQSGRPQTIKALGEPELEVLREAVRGLYREQLTRNEAQPNDHEARAEALLKTMIEADSIALSDEVRKAETTGNLAIPTALTQAAANSILIELRKERPSPKAIRTVLEKGDSWSITTNPEFGGTGDNTNATVADLVKALKEKGIETFHKSKDSKKALVDILGASSPSGIKGLFWPTVENTPAAVWDFNSVRTEEGDILIKPLRDAAVAYLTDKTALRTKILPAWVNLLLPAHSDATPVASASVRRITAWQGDDLASLREALVPLWDLHGMRAEALSPNREAELAKHLAHLWVIGDEDRKGFVERVAKQMTVRSVSGIADDTGLRLFQNATASLVKKSEELIFNIELLRTAQEALEFLRYMESPYIGVRPLGDYLSLDTAAAEAYGMSYDPWHTISTTFVRASTNADYVVMRDMNGNWQVKATKNDPTELINFIYGAALAAIEIATNAASGGTTGSSSALTGALTQHGKSLIENAQAGRINTWAMQELVDAYGEFYAKETKIVDDRIATLTNELDGDKVITEDQVAKAADEASKQALRDKQKGLVARANEVDGSTSEDKAKKDQLQQQVKGKRQDLVAAYKARQALEQEYDRFLSNAHRALLSSNAAADVPADGGKAEAAKGGIPKGTSPLESLVK